jgi:hypothetical protein
MAEEGDRTHPLLQLSSEEREFVLRLTLASGSLKDLAQHYGVSYPTIRARLDRLLERLRALVACRPRDPMAELLADFVERGEMAPSTARAVLELHHKELKRRKEAP